ncbi:hypothetical protein RQP53_07300 [Paucibacter sp. APW11]|uniref:Auto-transporter adhesin head GIN domain-containing protein n=1 Tax=Roseateles aquae TaxID=3077235 RepID=A0ABU3P919_9BURK|nr:hypothetical protein [Paucibacter sp. APW11]MDT8999069.1 hypothetical protein [Paucibacter sp. APW11]
MYIDKNRLLAVGAAVAALTLSACGGGGGGGSAEPTPGPTPGPGPIAATLSKDNYLDAFALVSLAAMRLDAVTTVIDGSFRVVLSTNDTPGTYPCPQGGTVSVARIDANTRSFSTNNCNLGGVIVNSGKLTAVGAGATVVGGVSYLAGGDFTADQLRFTIPDGIVGEQTLSGQIKLKRNADLTLSGSGNATVLRNGRSDVYKDIIVATSTPDSHHDVSIDTLNFTLDTPRFPVQLNVKAGATLATVSAPDGAQLRVDTNAKDDSIKLELRQSATASPSLTTTLKAAEQTVLDAFSRVLK